MPSLPANPAGTIRLVRGHPCPLIWEDRDAIWVRDDFRSSCYARERLHPDMPPEHLPAYARSLSQQLGADGSAATKQYPQLSILRKC